MANLGTHAGDAKAVATIATGSRHFRVTTSALAAIDPKANGDFELAAGTSIVLHYRTDTTGVTPPGPANNGDVVVYEDDNGSSIVATFTLADPSVDQDFTFHATSTGGSGGTPRTGTYRIRVRASRTDAGTYLAVSDDAGTPPAAGSTDFGKGFLRAGTSLASIDYSDVGLGGAAPANNRFVYPKSQFIRFTLGAQCLQAIGDVERDFNFFQRQAGAQKSTNVPNTSLTNPSVASLTRTGGVGLASGINNDFLAADTATDVRIEPQNSALSGQPWMHFTSLPASWTGTAGSLGTGFVQANGPALYTIDPRITFTQLLQLNSATWATPPSNNNVASGQRLASDLAFLAARATDAAGNGVNGLVWTEKLWDTAGLVSSEGSPWKSRTTTSAAQGGQAGWSDAFMTWDAQLPGGGWSQKEILTTTKATGLERTATRSLALLSADSNVKLIARVVPASGGSETAHLRAGDAMSIILTLIHSSQRKQIVADTAPTFVLLRFNSDLVRVEYLDTAFTWQSAIGATFDEFTTTVSPTDPDTYMYTFTEAQTAAWGSTDLLGVIATARVNSTPYVSDAPRELTGKSNGHDGYALDALGLALSGVLSQK